MSIREILTFENQLLHQTCEEIRGIDQEVLQLAEDLKDTLLVTPKGAGLAAPQIGVLRRMVYVNYGEVLKDKILINPRITHSEGEKEVVEACLSYVGYEGKLLRPQSLTVEAMGLDGEMMEFTFNDCFEVKLICHELDHLDGIVYTDKATYIYDVESLMDGKN